MRKAVTHFDKTSVAYLSEYKRQTAEGYSFRVRREKALAAIPKARSGAKALDVGCGPGIMIEGLRAKGYHVTCVDAAPAMIELAKKEYGELLGVEFVVGDVYSLPFPDTSFDIVIGMGLVEYLTEQNTAIADLARVMKKDGMLLVTFPNKWSPWRMFNRLVLVLLKPLRRRRKKDPESLIHREYTQKRVRDLFKQHNLQITAVHYYNFKLILYPFDVLAPRLTVWQSRLFERLDQTFLKWIGTGFTVVARRKAASRAAQSSAAR